MATRRIRILHLIHSSAFGGGPAMVELLCTRLHGDEFEMSLITSGEGEMPSRLAGLGMRVTCLPLATKGSFVRHLPQLARLLRRESPDLIHAHGHWAASLGQFAIQGAGRFSTIYSAQWPAYLDDTGVYSRARNWLAEWLSCRLARRVVAVSEQDRRTLIRRHLCAAKKLTVIYNAYDPAKFLTAASDSSRPAPTGGANGRAVLAFVGRLVDQKGCAFLIEAMPRVLQVHAQAKLLVVGEGPERPKLQELVQRLGLADAVRFLGYVPVSAGLFKGIDALVVPSIYEPFGIVALEAMACGRPVVASAVGGLREIVEDGKTGLLVKPGRSDDLSTAIVRLLDTPAILSEMGRAALRRVQERFSPEVALQAYAAEYRQLTQR